MLSLFPARNGIWKLFFEEHKLRVYSVLYIDRVNDLHLVFGSFSYPLCSTHTSIFSSMLFFIMAEAVLCSHRI